MNNDKEVSQNLSKFIDFEKFLIVAAAEYVSKQD